MEATLNLRVLLLLAPDFKKMKTLSAALLTFLSFANLWAQNTIGSGNSLVLDGTSPLAQVSNSTSSTLDYPISIAAWVKINNLSSTPSYPIYFSSNTATFYQGFWLTINPAGNLAFSFGDGGGTNNQAYRRTGYTNLSLSAGEWIHVAGVATSATNVVLYVNGESRTVSYSGSGTGIISNPASTAYIGQNSRTLTSFDGEIDELSVWSKALSQNEVRDLMCAKLSGSEPNLETYYRFDEAPSSGTIVDLSPNGDDVLISGTASFDTSFAPVGDRSVWAYSASSALSINGQGGVQIDAQPSSGSATGYHLYVIDTLPQPLPPGAQPPLLNHHFGIFGLDQNQDLDLSVALAAPFSPSTTYGLDWRDFDPSGSWANNSIRNSSTISLSNQAPNSQYCLMADAPCPITDVFPDDTTACDSVILFAPNSWQNIMWNTGNTGSTQVTLQSGFFLVSGTDTNGCLQVDSVQVTIVDPNAGIFPNSDTLICGSDRFDISLNIPDAQAYSWSTGSTSNSATVYTNTSIWVEVFYPGSCSVRDTMDVLFSDPAEALPEDSYVLCDGGSLDLELDPQVFINGFWSDGSTGMSLTITNPGMYWVRAVKPDGCEEFDTVRVESPAAADDLLLFRDTLFCVGTTLVLRSPDDSIQVRWPNGSDSTYAVDITKDIQVELSNGCTDTVNWFEARITSCECDVQFANAFTPFNRDGLNDEFGPLTECNFLQYELWISNRWGEMLFHTNEIGAMFKGVDREGNSLPSGTYLYRFHYATDRTSGMRQGYFHIVP